MSCGPCMPACWRSRWGRARPPIPRHSWSRWRGRGRRRRGSAPWTGPSLPPGVIGSWSCSGCSGTAGKGRPGSGCPTPWSTSAPEPTLSPDRTPSAPALRRWAPLAVAAVLVLALVTTLRQGGPGEGGVVRSGGGGPVLLGPPADGQVTLPATLVWSSLPGAVEYRVEVLDRSGGVLAEATLPASDTTWVLEGVAAPATVQWWVRGILPTGTPSASRLQALRIR